MRIFVIAVAVDLNRIRKRRSNFRYLIRVFDSCFEIFRCLMVFFVKLTFSDGIFCHFFLLEIFVFLLQFFFLSNKNKNIKISVNDGTYRARQNSKVILVSYHFVESRRSFENISDIFQIPFFLKLILSNVGKFVYQIVDISAKMLDGLESVMKIPEIGRKMFRNSHDT